MELYRMKWCEKVDRGWRKDGCKTVLWVVKSFEKLDIDEDERYFQQDNDQIEYMLRFNFDITYVKGEYNKVADCLSQYYESNTNADIHSPNDYVQGDRRIETQNGKIYLHICRVQELEKQRAVQEEQW